MDTNTERHQQVRIARDLRRAAFAHEAPPDDDGLDYEAEFQDRVDDYLADPNNVAGLAELIGQDPQAAGALRLMISDLYERARRAQPPEGDLARELHNNVRILGARAVELARGPIIDDILVDKQISDAACADQRRYGAVEG